MTGPRIFRLCASVVGVVAGCLWLASGSAHAQTRTVDMLQADFVSVESDSSGVVRRMNGNVRLRQDTTSLRADRVVQFESRGLVELSGNVQIIAGHDTLTASEVSYDANTKVARARTRVRLGDGESILYAPEVTYDSRAEVARFSGGGRILHKGATITSPNGSYSTARRVATLFGPLEIVDESGVVTADEGIYDARTQRADAVGSVRLRSPDSRLAADSLVYFRRTERARAFGRVALERIGSDDRPLRRDEVVTDSTRRTFLFGESLVYDRKASSALMRGSAARDPLMLLLSADSTGALDSTLVRAARLDLLRQVSEADTANVLTAAGSARIWQRRLAAVADSARIERIERGGSPTEDHLSLHGSQRPRAWAQGTQLTGDTLTALSRNEEVEFLRVVGAAFAARVDSVVGRVQQIQGDQILARIRGDDIQRLTVWPNAEAIYFRATSDSLLAGADRVKADSLVFRFADGELRELSGIRGITGTSYGPNILPATLQLSGYAFDPTDAPTRASVLDLDGWEADWLRQFGPAPPTPPLEAQRSPTSRRRAP